MILDKQIQDLQNNFKMVRMIRDNERDFTKVVDGVKEDYGTITKRYNNMVKKEIKQTRNVSEQGDSVIKTSNSPLTKSRDRFSHMRTDDFTDRRSIKVREEDKFREILLKNNQTMQQIKKSNSQIYGFPEISRNNDSQTLRDNMPTLKKLDHKYSYNQSQKILPTLKSQKNIDFHSNSTNSLIRPGPYNDSNHNKLSKNRDNERASSNGSSERAAITIKDQKTGRNSKMTANKDAKNSFVLSWNAVDPPSFRPQQGREPAGSVMLNGGQA